MMTNRPQKQRECDLLCPQKPKPQKRHLSLFGWGVTVILLGVGGGTVAGGFLIQRNLTPVVEEQLSDFLNRPVELGSLQSFSVNHVRFGKTDLLTTPNDPAKVSMSALKIAYNPIKYIMAGKLEIEVTAIEPSAYLEQGKEGNWLLTKFKTLNPNNPIKFKSLGFEKGQAIIVSRSSDGEKKPAINLQQLSGKIEVIGKNNNLRFQVKSNVVAGGAFQVSGVADTENNAVNLLLRGHQLNGVEISQVLPLPLDIETGKIDANLEVSWQQNQLPQLQGVARLNQVSAKVPELPHPFQTQGQLRFKGTKINFDEVITQFGEVTGIVNGDLDLDKGFNLTAKTQPTSITNIFTTIKQQPANIAVSGQVQGDLKVTGSLTNPNVLISLTNTDLMKIDRIDFRHIKTSLQLNKSYIKINNFQALPTVGGKLTGKGNIDLNHSSPLFTIDIEGKNIPTASLASIYKKDITGNIGQVSTNINLSGNIKKPETFKATGKANFQVAGGTIKAEHITYINGNWQGNIIASAIKLNSLDLPIKEGELQGQFQVAGNIKNSTIDSLKATGQAKIQVNNGSILAKDVKLSQGQWHTGLGIHGVNINKIIPNTHLQGKLQGNFDIAGNLNSNFKNIQAKGQGNLAIGGGKIYANSLQLNQGKWSSKLTTKDVSLNSLIAQVPKHLSGKLNSNLTVAGNLDTNAFLDSIEGKGDATLILSQGAIAADNLTITQGKFTTNLTPQSVPLTLISSDLTGNLSGNLDIVGKINKISPENLQANGELQLSPGLPHIIRPLTTAIQWNGQRLTLDKVTASGLQGKGWLDIDFKGKQDKLEVIKEFYLDIDAKNFDLTSLPLSSPIPGLTYSGKLDFNGAMAGTTKTPNIEGEMALINFKLGDINFEPVLSGKIVKKAQKGLKLQLDGQKDQLHLEFDPQLQPLILAVRQGNIETTATKQEEQWKIDATAIPLPLIQKFAQIWYKENPLLSQPMTGDLSGKFTVDLKTGAIAGQDVAILNPIIGTIQGKQFKGNFHYANESLSLQDGKIFINNSQYDLNGQFTKTPQGPEIAANLNINQGNLQDILETLQIFELEDLKRGFKPPKYAKAADLYPKSSQNAPSPQTPLFQVETSQGSLNERIEKLKEITAWLDQKQQQKQENANLPQLKRLQGEFNGQLALNITPKTGIEAKFNLLGQQWQWGPYQLSQFQAQGNWKQGILTLEPFSLQLGESMIGFAGQVGEKSQHGQLQVRNIPLDTLSQWVNLPTTVTLGGQLNGKVDLGGTRDNPQASGNLNINNPTINQTALDSSQGQFTYDNGQFNFTANSVLGRHSEPLTIEGTFPYSFPLAKVQPKNDRLSLKFQAQNEGLTLVNILSKGQIAWLGGRGEVQLKLSGKVDPKRGIPYELQANGLAQIKNATIATQMMPQSPLKKVQGKIFFDLDTITFDNFIGQFSGGQVAVLGSLPLLNPTTQKQSLTVQLNNLAFDLPQLYQGGINGYLNILGSVLNPNIGGKVNLFNGEIMLGDKIKKQGKKNSLLARTQLKGLQLNLGDKIVINRLPILTFLATGNLTLNGTLDKPKPEGQITLENGLVNLFASQLRLAGGKENTAQFLPHKGFDPYLNIKLFASATEPNQNTFNIEPNSSEIAETFSANKDGLETVRIKANVKGFASEISKSIQLSSQPKRSQQQIITLLGGTFLNTLGTGETTLGLANLAGTAVFGPVQGAIGEALGLSEFRIFPTPLINAKDALDTSNIGVAAEAGLDLTEDLSLSIQTIVNGDRPPKLGLQYRINDSTTLRGSSNFSDDSRGSIQFEQRF